MNANNATFPEVYRAKDHPSGVGIKSVVSGIWYGHTLFFERAQVSDSDKNAALDRLEADLRAVVQQNDGSPTPEQLAGRSGAVTSPTSVFASESVR